ncbi:hypothetical protein KY285_023852 [Solanum tuberosum]|nr:hypothetical protein KY285_023852 [Solanum tuberosum]
MAPKAKNMVGGAGYKRSQKGGASVRMPKGGRIPWGQDRSKDTGRHSALHYANFNQVAKVWLKIVCSVFLPAKHLTDVMRDWVFLRIEGIKEEELDMNITRAPNLTGNMVDVTPTKVLDTSHVPILLAQERKAQDDSVMAHMFGMAELQLRIGGRPITDNEMETLAKRYPLTESAAYFCRIGPAFQKPFDDDETTTDKEMDDEEDDIVDDDAIDEDADALMVFDGGHADDES